MSIQAMHYVFWQSPATMGARLVLLALANHANDAYLSWPAVQTVAHEARMDRRSVQRALRDLEDAGEIEAAGNYSRGGRRATTYLLIRCRGFYADVGGPTPEKPYAKPTVTVGKRDETVYARSENSPIPRHSAAPAAAYIPPHPRHSAAPGAAIRRPCSGAAPPLQSIFDAPGAALTTEYRGTAPPYPSVTIKEPRKNQEPPLTPLAGGRALRAPKPVTLSRPGVYLVIHKPRRQVLFGWGEREKLRTATPDQVAEHFRAKGWRVEVRYEQNPPD
jgi:Helix-turn-helix domain